MHWEENTHTKIRMVGGVGVRWGEEGRHDIEALLKMLLGLFTVTVGENCLSSTQFNVCVTLYMQAAFTLYLPHISAIFSCMLKHVFFTVYLYSQAFVPSTVCLLFPHSFCWAFWAWDPSMFGRNIGNNFNVKVLCSSLSALNSVFD